MINLKIFLFLEFEVIFNNCNSIKIYEYKIQPFISKFISQNGCFK